MARDPLELLEGPLIARVADRLVSEAQARRRGARRPVRRRSRRALAAPRGRRRRPPRHARDRAARRPRDPRASRPRAGARDPRGAAVLPLMLRGRALSALVFAAPPSGDLEALAARGAAALELAERHTDVLANARRHRECSAAAELQQDLLPPRIGHLEGAEVAGSILPAYDVGGDWIDHCAMADGGWLGVADAVGKGPQASAIGAIALGAYRAARRGGVRPGRRGPPHPRGDLRPGGQRDLHERRAGGVGRPVVVAVVAALRAPARRWSGTPARAARAAGRRRPGPRARPTRSAARAGVRGDRRRRARRPRLRRRARARRARHATPSARTACTAPWRRWRRPRPPRRRPRCSRRSGAYHDGPLRDDASVLVLAPR